MVHLTTLGEDQDTISKAVKSWFETPASGNWTIVIDNLDDIELGSRLYMPVCHGEILFTTRDRRILGHPGLAPAGAGIKVSRMSEKEGMEAFNRIVGSEGDVGCPAVGQLLTLLDGLPLAIAQAAAYIRTTHMPTSHYLALFQESERNQQELLSEPLPAALRNDKTDPTKAVMTTWQLTVQRIEQESPLSVKMLQILSFLDPDNLPSSIIEVSPRPKISNHFKQLAPLLNFGLLTQLGSSGYRLHRLVGLWTRVKMNSDVKHQRIDQALGLMEICFPRGSSTHVTKYIGMLPHAVSILDHIGSDYSKFSVSWELQQNVSHFLCGIGRAHLAMKHARLSLRQEQVFEQDEAKRYISRSMMGDIYESMAEYPSAIHEYQLALDGQEKILGKGHPDTLGTVQNIAIVFWNKGEYDKALKWYQRALDGKEKVLGKDHIDTLLTVQNMAIVFWNKGEYDKALEWYQRALDGNEKVLGKGHPDTLRTVHNMAIVFRNKGEYDRALEWNQRALDGQEKVLGKDHPDTLLTVHNMANVFRNKGEYDKALEWSQRALDGQEKVLGKDHPDTLLTVHNMANVFRNKGEYDKALEWYQRALDGREKVLGKCHPDTLMTVQNMANVFQNKGEYDRAQGWNQRALDGQEKVLGKDHPDTLLTVHNMANVFSNKGEYDMAQEWNQRALDGQEKVLGRDHPDTLLTVHNMAIVFRNKGEYGKALEWSQWALDGQEKALGLDHPVALSTVHSMARVFQDKGEYDKALEWHQRALDGQEKVLGKDHPDTLLTVQNMALVFHNKGEYDKALGWYQRALDGNEKALGKDHPKTLQTVHNMAFLFQDKGGTKKPWSGFNGLLMVRKRPLEGTNLKQLTRQIPWLH